MRCIADNQVDLFVDNYFSKLIGLIAEDGADAKKDLLSMQFGSGSNLIFNGLIVTASGTSDAHNYKIFKNHDDENSCLNWIILYYKGVFDISSDSRIWRESK